MYTSTVTVSLFYSQIYELELFSWQLSPVGEHGAAAGVVVR